jgi:hypothetical protein
LFVERQFATLLSDLDVDSTGVPGNYDDVDNMPGGTVSAGMVVDSFLLHLDPTDQAFDSQVTITFDNDILGVIAEEANLVDSDILAYASADFDNALSDRGSLEAQDDGWLIAPDGRTITFDFQVDSNSIDQFRIITQSTLQFQLPGDFDLNGSVDGADFLAWQRGESPDPLSASDLADWEANYGTPASPVVAATATVPEPSTSLLVLINSITCLTLAKRRRCAHPSAWLRCSLKS